MCGEVRRGKRGKQRPEHEGPEAILRSIHLKGNGELF